MKDLKGLKGLKDLKGLKGLKDLKDLKGLKDLKDLKGLKGLKVLKDLKGLNFDFLRKTKIAPVGCTYPKFVVSLDNHGMSSKKKIFTTVQN